MHISLNRFQSLSQRVLGILLFLLCFWLNANSQSVEKLWAAYYKSKQDTEKVNLLIQIAKVYGRNIFGAFQRAHQCQYE